MIDNILIIFQVFYTFVHKLSEKYVFAKSERSTLNTDGHVQNYCVESTPNADKQRKI